MNEFETKVLEVLARVADGDTSAEWESGTLFVECSPAAAALYESEFIQAFRCGIIVSKIGPEFSFDFI
jgi:hypothetical protein